LGNGTYQGLKAGTATVEISTVVACNEQCVGVEDCCCVIPVSTTVTITVTSGSTVITGDKDTTPIVTDPTPEPEPEPDIVPDPQPPVAPPSPPASSDNAETVTPTPGPTSQMPYTGGFLWWPLLLILGVGCVTAGIIVKRKLVKD